MRDLADADLRLESARIALHELVRAASKRAQLGEPLDRRLLARLYLANLHATDTAVEVTSTAHRFGGGAAASADSRLLRALNDVHAARQHYQFAAEHRIGLARVPTGITDTYPPYIT